MAILWLLPSASFADCTPTDLRPALGAPRDQGETGWCFAHTTADLLSQTLGFRVSAGAVASDFVLSRPADIQKLGSGQVKSYVKENPRILREIDEARTSEPDHWYSKNLFGIDRTRAEDGSEMLSFRGLFDIGGTESAALVVSNLHGVCASEKLPDGNDQYNTYALELERRWLQKNQAELLLRGCPQNEPISAEAENLVKIFQNSLLDPVFEAELLRNYVKEKCGARTPLAQPLLPKNVQIAASYPKWKALASKKPAEAKRLQQKLFTELDANLDRGKASAIGYDYCEHGKPDPESGECSKYSTTPGRPFYPEQDHSAIVAARKPINGVCHYFVRNSTGPTCEFTHPRFGNRCEADAGGVWVSRQELKSLYSVMSIR